MPNGSFSTLFEGLKEQELERLEQILLFAQRSGIDPAEIEFDEVIEELRTRPIGQSSRSEPPQSVNDLEQWRDRMSGGRVYELTLDGHDYESANTKYEEEWRRARTLNADGMSYEDAWKRIRRDAMLSAVEDDDEQDVRPTRRRRRR
jgi:hypothetical protein